MPIDAFLSFLAKTFLREVLAHWNFVFLIHVQILARLTFFALSVHPVYADCSLPLRLIYSLILRFNYS